VKRTVLKIAATLLAVLIAPALCTACNGSATTLSPTQVPTPPPTPSPTPEPKTLVVCTPNEPDSLYLYGAESPIAQHVWETIYDGPLDSRTYSHQPVILTELPSLTNGSATLKTVAVQAGDRALAANGEVIELSPGVVVEDAEGRRVTLEEGPVLMRQMVATFTLRANLYWSDGILLTGDDSVFSFELAADPATPGDKYIVNRSADYRAVDMRTVVWSGVPGFLDHFYYLNFWRPLPRHAWGHLSAAQLLTAEVSTRRPIGWGGFVIHEWTTGDQITLVRNPIYFRAHEGLPRLDEITLRFIADPTKLAQELLTGGCDVVTHDAAEAARAALPNQPPVQVISTHDARWEALAFGISPAQGHDRPDFFEDVRVRQAIAHCIDRQAIAQQVLGASGRTLHSYLPPEHPLHAGDTLTAWGHDPEAGRKLLAQAGWYDEDADGVREAHNIPGVPEGAPFQVTYQTTDDPLRVQTAQLVQTYLNECGIQAIVEAAEAETLFAPGPEGALFGRRFDLAQFSWRAGPDPFCDLFLSSQIPDAGRWDGPNVVGFLDDEYDTACLSALKAAPGSAEYAAGHAEAQRICSEQLPLLPLFQRQRITLASAEVVGLAPDPTQASELWNAELLDLQP